MRIYFPVDFYELWGGMLLKRTSFRRDPINFPVVLSDLPLFLQSGHIIALHDAENSISAEESRLQPIFLKIGLKCTNDDDDEARDCHAKGKLAISQSMQITFESTYNKVSYWPARELINEF